MYVTMETFGFGLSLLSAVNLRKQTSIQRSLRSRPAQSLLVRFVRYTEIHIQNLYICEKPQSEQCWYSFSHVIQRKSDWKASAGSRDWQCEQKHCQLFSTHCHFDWACCSWALTRSQGQLRSDSGSEARTTQCQALNWACAWAFCSQHVEQICRVSRSDWKAATDCEKS